MQEEGVQIEYIVTLCSARYRLAWLVPLFGYKFVIQFIGVYLAFRIRKVKVRISDYALSMSTSLSEKI